MTDYRANKMPQQASNEDARPSQLPFLPALAAKYGFDGDDAWNPPIQGSIQMVESEFNDYVLAPLWGTSDSLAYWVVSERTCTIINNFTDDLRVHYYLDCERDISYNL